MGSRAYVRSSNGKFAGSGSGGKVTYGKAGGFANASFRARVAAGRGSASAARPSQSNGAQKASRGKSLAVAAGARGRSVGRRAAKSKSLRRAGLAAGGLAVSSVALGGAKPTNTRIAVGVLGLAAANAGIRPKSTVAKKLLR